MLQRRVFLKAGGFALMSIAAGPRILDRNVFAAGRPAASGRRKLVTIFQRGAMDGLMAVAPTSDDQLRRWRPRLTMSATREAGEGALLDLGVGFALHPSFRGLLPLWRKGNLAVVHCVGISAPPSRTHHEAQMDLETGTPGQRETPDGWLNRMAGQLGSSATPWRAVSMTSELPRVLSGPQPVQVIGERESSLGVERLQRAFRASYPASPLGRRLRTLAHLVKSDVGVELAFVESGGWDTHIGQGTHDGSFARSASDLACSIAAFWQDLGPHQDEVVVMTMTEFGRTVAENGSGGTDHGHGSCLFLLGNRIDGGRVHGEFPGIDQESLYEGRDLPATTDIRAVFSEVARRHLGVDSIEKVFPGWTGDPLPLFRAS